MAWLAALPPPVACALLGSVTSIDVPESSRLEAVESAAGCRTGVWPVPFSLPIAGWIYCGEAVRGADALVPDGDELWLIGTRRAEPVETRPAYCELGLRRRAYKEARSRLNPRARDFKFGAVASTSATAPHTFPARP